jgi:hypothetical protein
VKRIVRNRPEKHCEVSLRKPILSLAEKTGSAANFFGGQQCVDTFAPFSQLV